ncbi:inositol phospholipid synthesis and fat-storage-inducing TM-domain-containing protein [Daldinia sp. FL1419]|nr:inositol phospholipid synthesis and fat-storage-inducing TM-domain-containing protein [Daldinia sp. FL1419]
MTDDNITSSLRSRQQASMASMAADSKINGSSSFSDHSEGRSTYSSPSSTRTSPFLPTPLETVALLVYPTILAFGTVFSVISPQTRASPYDPAGQSHVASAAPSYFARKDNVFNVVFVKRGWAWISIAFATFVLTHPALGSARKKVRAAGRWALVTTWWMLVTQWCLGPPIIDRGFRFTGGKCEVAREALYEGTADKADVFTAAACKAAGGRWSGGHDISGHVFLLVLGSFFLLQEIGWGVFRAGREERCVVMPDGAVKGAGVEAESAEEEEEGKLGVGGKFAIGVVVLCLWMLLMTAIYFHTWFEKVSLLPFFFVFLFLVFLVKATSLNTIADFYVS